MKNERLPTTTVDRSQIANEAIAEFLHAVEIGESPDRSNFINNHSGVRTALNSFFDAYDQMEGEIRTDESKVGSFLPGQRLGRHNLVRPIGSGSFGTVWLGFDSKLKRPVAIKVPNQDRFASQVQRDLFLSEAQTVAQLDHPNIVPIYDVGETETGVIYLVSRFVLGNDLATEMRNRKYSFSETAKCLADIASALKYAHGRNLIHRDVKPSNILIDAQTGRSFITDFGLAHNNKNRQEKSAVGTPAYMSPEQASGKQIDHRSDLFSMGIVLFEMLCGERPFQGKDTQTLMKAIREDSPPIPNQINPKVPKPLQSVCLKSLSKSFDDRYESSEELESDLRTFLKTQTTSLQQKPATDIQSTRNKWRTLTLASISMLLIAGSIWLAIPWLTNPAVPGDKFSGPTQLIQKDDGATNPDSARSPSTSLTNTKSLDRRIAERTIDLGGHIDVCLEEASYEVDSIDAIPDGDISLLWVMFNNHQTIDDEFLGSLRGLDSLIGIDLHTCKFSESGFSVLGDIKTLRYVYAHSTQLTDKGAACLGELPHLAKLNLKGTKTSNEALRHFEGSNTLKVLRIASNRISNEGLKYIGTMPNLEELNLSNRLVISDEGIKHLSSLKNLEMIDLSQTKMTGKSFDYITSSPLLRVFVPSSLPPSVQETEFQRAHPDCKIFRQ